MDTLREVEDVIASRPVKLLNGHWHDNLPGVAWWRDLATGGGQMVEQATHLVDLSRRLLGEATVVAATADLHPHPDFPEMDVPDVSTAILRYDAGQVGTFTATCILGGTSAQEIRLFADDLAITVRQQGVLYEDAREKAVTATDGFTGSRLWGVTATRYVPTGNDPFRAENRAFLDAIRHGDASRLFSSYADALRTHRLTCAIRAAGGGGRPPSQVLGGAAAPGGAARAGARPSRAGGPARGPRGARRRAPGTAPPPGPCAAGGWRRGRTGRAAGR